VAGDQSRRREAKMELYIFGRFLVLDGKESAFEAALGEVVTATRAETGCVEVHGYRGVRNARLYYLHSRWKDVETFELHAKLPHTEKFLGRVEKLLAEPRDVKRCERVV
jgi:quinol monooxygenase YgiN